MDTEVKLILLLAVCSYANVVFGYTNVVFGFAQTTFAGRLSEVEGGNSYCTPISQIIAGIFFVLNKLL